MRTRLSELLAFNTIGAKLTTIICAIIACGFSVIIYFYASQQEKNHLLQNERAINQVLGSVSEGLQTVMITGSAVPMDNCLATRRSFATSPRKSVWNRSYASSPVPIL